MATGSSRAKDVPTTNTAGMVVAHSVTHIRLISLGTSFDTLRSSNGAVEFSIASIFLTGIHTGTSIVNRRGAKTDFCEKTPRSFSRRRFLVTLGDAMSRTLITACSSESLAATKGTLAK